MVAAPSIPVAHSPTSSTELRAKAHEIFERYSPYPDLGFLHHCQRLHRFAVALMAKRHLEFDPDVAYLIALCHDLGIVCDDIEGKNYLERSLNLFRRETADLDLRQADAETIAECLLYNHRLLPMTKISAEAECFRKAVMIEHSRGKLRFGLDRAEVRGIFEAFPRANFDRVLADFTWRTLKREPFTLAHGIFF